MGSPVLLFPEVSEVGGAKDNQHRSRKALMGSLQGVQSALGPPKKALGAGCCLSALQARAEPCFEGRWGGNWILKTSPKFKSSCNLNRNLLLQPVSKAAKAVGTSCDLTAVKRLNPAY